MQCGVVCEQKEDTDELFTHTHTPHPRVSILFDQQDGDTPYHHPRHDSEIYFHRTMGTRANEFEKVETVGCCFLTHIHTCKTQKDT